jgi:uncharacterized protein YeeX (DUF496 family)
MGELPDVECVHLFHEVAYLPTSYLKKTKHSERLFNIAVSTAERRNKVRGKIHPVRILVNENIKRVHYFQFTFLFITENMLLVDYHHVIMSVRPSPPQNNS